MQTAARYLLAHIDDVLAEWNALWIEEPWICLPERERLDDLPRLITTVVEAALLEPHEIERHRAMVAAAAEHGRQRRSAGLEEDVIFQEAYGLRNAIACIVRRVLADQRMEQAMLRIDSALTVALQASLLGFHEAGLPAGRDWTGQLEALARESPLLRLRPPSIDPADQPSRAS